VVENIVIANPECAQQSKRRDFAKKEFDSSKMDHQIGLSPLPM
jgi:hypothetical protein